MYHKYSIHLLFITLFSLLIISCGDDDKNPTEPEEEEILNRGWYEIDSSRNYGIMEIEYVNEDVIYMISGGLIKSTDGGITWDSLSVNEIKFDITSQYMLHFENEDVGYINILNSTSIPSNSLYKTTDGGITWQELNLPNEGEGEIYYFKSFSKKLYLVSYFFSYVSDDDGSSWERIELPNDQLSSHNLHFINDNIGFIMSYDGIYKTMNGGKDWSKVSDLYFYNNNFVHLYFKDENVGWAWAYHLRDTDKKTTDGGKTWQETQISARIRYIKFANNNEGWLVTDNSIYYTSDGGINWNVQLQKLESHFRAIDILNKKEALIGGRKLYKTKTGGNK